ncbi:hypothetical protein CUU64_21000 [Bacillus sp. V5-8f]|nr:hypothetical protein CUU64_21000 [Bacillus sp. V5-8f]
MRTIIKLVIFNMITVWVFSYYVAIIFRGEGSLPLSIDAVFTAIYFGFPILIPISLILELITHFFKIKPVMKLFGLIMIGVVLSLILETPFYLVPILFFIYWLVEVIYIKLMQLDESNKFI